MIGTPPSVFWRVVLMLEAGDLGIILIIALGWTHRKPIGTIIPDMNTTRSLPLRGMQDLTNWNSLMNDAGRSDYPVWNDIFRNAGRKKMFKLKKLSAKIRIQFTLTWLTATPINLYQIKLIQIKSNRITLYQIMLLRINLTWIMSDLIPPVLPT